MTFLERNKVHENVKSLEFRLPKPTSKCKRWYIVFDCIKCGEEYEAIVPNNKDATWVCNPCSKGKWTREEFISKVEAKYPDKYTFEKLVWKNTKTNVVITCKKHGDVNIRPKDLLYKKTKNGCRYCSEVNRLLRYSKKSPTGILYYIYFPTLKMWKMGITMQRDVTQRMRRLIPELQNYEIIWTIQDSSEILINIEQLLFSKLEKFRFYGESCLVVKRKDKYGNPILKDNGSNELLTENVFPTVLDVIEYIRDMGVKEYETFRI